MAWLGGTAFMGTTADASAASKPQTRPAGTAYVASSGNGGVQIVLSTDGRQVRTALFAYKLQCSDGSISYDYDVFEKLPVSATRKFSYSYDSGPKADPALPGATFAYTQSISGTLNKAGTKIVGTARAALSYTDAAGAVTTCDTGTIAFKAAD
jgi:hypothetical protein